MKQEKQQRILGRKTVLLLVGFVLLVLLAYPIVRYANPSYSKRMDVIAEVEHFSFENHRGEWVTDNVWKGKIGVVYFFFTSCQNICPLMYETVKEINTAFKHDDRFVVLGYTCDPDRDSVARLETYALEHHLPSNWLLMTGEKKALYEVARFSYRIEDPREEVGEEYNFMHTQHIAVVDNGKVVRIFDGLKKKDIEKAKQKIQTLLDDLSLQEREL